MSRRGRSARGSLATGFAKARTAPGSPVNPSESGPGGRGGRPPASPARVPAACAPATCAPAHLACSLSLSLRAVAVAVSVVASSKPDVSVEKVLSRHTAPGPCPLGSNKEAKKLLQLGVCVRVSTQPPPHSRGSPGGARRPAPARECPPATALHLPPPTYTHRVEPPRLQGLQLPWVGP